MAHISTAAFALEILLVDSFIVQQRTLWMLLAESTHSTCQHTTTLEKLRSDLEDGIDAITERLRAIGSTTPECLELALEVVADEPREKFNALRLMPELRRLIREARMVIGAGRNAGDSASSSAGLRQLAVHQDNLRAFAQLGCLH